MENQVQETEQKNLNAPPQLPIGNVDFKVLLSFGAAIISFIIGLHKMHAYDNGEYSDEYVNTYVGGDAYNYIINANYTTACFVMALLFTVMACTFLICNAIKNK